MVACARGDLAPGPLEVELAVAPVDPVVPLVRTLEVTLSAPATVTLTLDDDDREPVHAFGPVVRLDLTRLLPDHEYGATVAAVDPQGRSAQATIAFRTDPLPADFPEIVVHASEPDRMEPGDTLLAPGSDDGPDYAVVLDPDGDVVWLYAPPGQRVWEIHPTDHGTLLAWYNHGDIVELDWRGRVLGRWSAEGVGGDGIQVPVPLFHHDVEQLPDGTILALTQDAVSVDDFPVSYDDPTITEDGAQVLVDRVIGFSPDDGSLRFDLPATDWLPQRRIGYESLRTDLGAGYDWAT